MNPKISPARWIFFALLSLAAFSFLSGDWRIALALLYLIGIHEMGHLWAMQQKQIPTQGFLFIPFLGGAAIGGAARSEWDDVYVTAMGPTIGALSVIPPLLLVEQSVIFVWTVKAGLLINLFNLLPVFPLDGGRILRSLALSLPSHQGRPLLYISFAASLLVLFWLQTWVILLLVLFMSRSLFSEFSGGQPLFMSQRPLLNLQQARAALLWYFGLAALLLGALIYLF